MSNDTLPPVQTIDMAGERFVVLREADYCRLTGESVEHPLPEQNEHGNYPALDAMRVIMSRDILRSRQTLGLTQQELAEQAGIRVETLCRIERGHRDPTAVTLKKLDRVFTEAEKKQKKKRT